jgi:ribose-phosphate pyrophosphokinase
MIIANPQGKAWNFANSIYTYLKERSDKYYISELQIIKKFRDGEIKVKIKDNIRKKNCFFIQDSSLNPADWLMHLLLTNKAVHDSSPQEVINVLPYMKFARQDRKDQSRVAISSKAVADMIGLYANRVLTMDAHFTQIQGFYNIPLDNLYSSKVLLKNLKENHPDFLENLVVMSPDIGGASRARAFADKLGIERIVIGDKQRPKEGEVSDEFNIIGDVAGKKVLLIDDILDSGNTLEKAVKEIKKKGASRVYAYCTHGLFTENAREKVKNNLDLMMVTDSIPQEKSEKVEIIPVAEFFGEAIYRTNEGKSLSQLFE